MASVETDQRQAKLLLEWLEEFAERLKGRTNAVAEEVQQVVEEMGAVELNLQNTFNNFRCLSSSQYVEHHVYEEDETDLVTIGMSKKDPKHLPMPTESYEDEILPRYKDAVSFAWEAFEGGGRQDEQRRLRRGSRTKPRDSHQEEEIQILPLIIGSEEFSRDEHCGLADLRRHHEPASDSDEQSDKTVDLAAKPIETGNLSDGETSGTDSEVFDSQEESLEPAVSAALDFKAMLEAALRNPSLPYDGAPNDSFGEFADNKFSLPSLTDDYLNDSPRNISTMVDIIGRTMSTMDESKEELRDQRANANIGSSQSPLAPQPPAAMQQDRLPSASAFAELLKNSLSQATSSQDLNQHIEDDNRSTQVGTGDLGQVPFIPGDLFNDDAPDTGFPAQENAVVSTSETGPSIPEGLFKEQQSPKRTQRTRSTSRSSNSFDSSHSLPLTLPSLPDTLPKSSGQDSDSADRSQKYGATNFQSSLIQKQPRLQPSSSASNVVIGSQQTGRLPIRGGLFDDDDEDEDENDLFGAPAPRADSQPVLRPWASQSSKGLFDDLTTDDGGAELFSDEADERSPEVQRRSGNFSSMASQQDQEQEATDLSEQPIERSSHVGNSKSSPPIGSTESTRTTPVESMSSNSIGESPERSSPGGRSQIDVGTSSGVEATVSESSRDVKENLQQLPIHSAVAAAIRSSVPFVAESDDDDDSWSGSESGGEGVIEETVNERSGREEDATILNLGEEKRESLPEDASPRRADDGLSDAKEILTGAVPREEDQRPAVSSQTAPVAVASARSPPLMPRSFVSTESSPVKVPVNFVDNPLLPSKTHELSDTEAEADPLSDSSASSDSFQGIGQGQAAPSIFPDTSSPAENLMPSTSQPTRLGNETSSPAENLIPFASQRTTLRNEASFSSSAQSSRENRISEDQSTASSITLPAPASEIGRPTPRTFTSLFGDDDPEEDLLFQAPSKPQRSSVVPKMRAGQDKTAETESPSTAPDVPPQLPPPVSNPKPLSDPSVSSRSPSFVNKEGDPAAKSGSKLSSLLFGDDDEDDEDALFGPLGGRASRVLKSSKGGSLFGDAD